MIDKLNVLLTGSSGNISKNTIIPSLKEFNIIEFDLAIGDNILDKKSIQKKMVDIDVVIHTAGIPGPTKANSFDDYLNVNFNGTKNLIDIALEKRVPKFIFFSSFARYGVDSWMRYRNECGPIIGNDIAVPKYLPIDELHPSINAYKELFEWGGKWYGKSKALAEKYGEEKSNDNFSFIPLRLAGFRELNKKLYIRKLKVSNNIKKNLKNNIRKQFIYSLAGVTPKSLLIESLKSLIKNPTNSYDPFNIVYPGIDLQEITKNFFPTLQKQNKIFSNEKIIKFLKKNNNLPSYEIYKPNFFENLINITKYKYNLL